MEDVIELPHVEVLHEAPGAIYCRISDRSLWVPSTGIRSTDHGSTPPGQAALVLDRRLAMQLGLHANGSSVRLRAVGGPEGAARSTSGETRAARTPQLDVGAWDDLCALARDSATSENVRRRALIILLAACGVPSLTIARTLRISRPTIAVWRGRFALAGVPGLFDRPSRPRRSTALVTAFRSRLQSLLVAITTAAPDLLDALATTFAP